jgi:integrase
MPKKVKSLIDEPAQRKGLTPSSKAYYESFERGVDFGYRKGALGGSWVLRRYLGREIGYREEKVGRADDDATRPNTLSYGRAREIARERIKALAGASMPVKNEPPLTVERAIKEYVAARDSKEIARRSGDAGRKGLKKDAGSRLKHVDPALASKPLADVTTDDLTTWREGLKGMTPSTVRRIANDLKAALNAAAKRHRKKLPASVRGDIRETIKDGLATPEPEAPPARDMQVLSDDEVRALVEAAERVDEREGWGGDFAIIVRVLAATGARFSQIIRMRVGDVLHAQQRLNVPVSFKGRGKKKKTHIVVSVASDVMAALAKMSADRKASEPLFLRPEKERVTFTQWRTVGRGPWYAASELLRPWAKVVAEAGLPPETIIYAMRHASIFRNLRNGLGTEHVAKLHDTSEKMVSAHYTFNLTTALDEIAAKAVISFAVKPPAPPPPDDKVISINRGRAAS